MAQPFAGDVDHRDGRDEHEHDRAYVLVVLDPDRGEQLLADAAGADEADHRGRPDVQFETPERIGGEVRQDLRHHREADRLDPVAAGGTHAVERADPDFALWVDQQVIAHKTPGYAIANISLKPIGGIGGDATAEQMEVVADLAERYSFDDVRVTHAQNLVLPHVRKQDLYEIGRAHV